MPELIIDRRFQTDPVMNRGYRGLMPRDWKTNPYGSIACATPYDLKLIDRSEWKDRIRQMEKDQSRLSDILKDAGLKALNQMRTNYCHANAPAMAIMVLRAVQGIKLPVPLSPASIAGPITGFRNEGAYIHQDLRQITEVGCASQDFVPANQIGREGFRTGWEADAAKNRVTEWFDFPEPDGKMFDRIMTCLLSGIPVCTAHNWWGHAVLALDPWFDAQGYGTRDINSWGEDFPEQGDGGFFILREQPATADEAYAPRSLVMAV